MPKYLHLNRRVIALDEGENEMLLIFSIFAMSSQLPCNR